MSETLLIAERMAIKHHLDALKSLCEQLQSLLLELPDLNARITGLVDNPGNSPSQQPWRVASEHDITQSLRIFSKFCYEEGQEPREAKKFPAIIQLNPRLHQPILECVQAINEHKDALKQCNTRLKSLMGKQSSEVWQEMQRFASIIQILRHISIIQDDVSYLGLSFMIKPVVQRLDKEKALRYLDEKIAFCTKRSSFLSRIPFLDEARRQVMGIDESSFEIKMARQGSPRYMVNAKGVNKDYQVMASMPVFVFSRQILGVSLPQGKKRQPRKDKRIPLGEIKSEFGIYLVPKKPKLNVFVTN